MVGYYAAGSGSHTEQRIKSDDGGAGMKTLFVNESATFVPLGLVEIVGISYQSRFPILHDATACC